MCLFPVFVLVPCLYYCTVSTGNVRFTRFALVPCCGCTLAQCVPCLYLLPVFVLVPCVYYCTVGTGNVRFTRFVLVRACTTVQSARVMYVLPVLYSCRAVAVLLHRFLYSRHALTIAQSARVIVRFTRFVLVPCCGCTVAIAPCVDNVPFTRFCTRVVRVFLHGASTGRVLIGQVRTRAVAVPLHGVYRACTVVSSHIHIGHQVR